MTPNNPAHIAQDVNSTHVLVLAGPGVPQAQVMTCTGTNVENPADTFTAPFLINPVTR